MSADRVVDLFVAAGEIAHDENVLDDGLRLLAARLDLKGAGDLLTAITDRTCWEAHGDVCPRCGHKRDPQPHPRPPKPPPPPPPKGGR